MNTSMWIILICSLLGNAWLIWLAFRNKRRIDLMQSCEKFHLDTIDKLHANKNKLTTLLSRLGTQYGFKYLEETICEMVKFSDIDNEDCDALSRDAIIKGIKLLKHKYFQLLIDCITASPRNPNMFDTILNFNLSLLNIEDVEMFKKFNKEICAVFNAKIDSLLTYSDFDKFLEQRHSWSAGWQIPEKSTVYLMSIAENKTFDEYEAFRQNIACIDSYQGKIETLEKTIPLLERELIGMDCRKEIGSRITGEIKLMRDELNMKNDSHVKLASILIDIQNQVENIIDDFEQKAGIDHAIKVGMNMVEKQKSTSDTIGRDLAGPASENNIVDKIDDGLNYEEQLAEIDKNNAPEGS